MARSIDTIQKQIIDQVQADPDLSPLLTSTSKRAIWRLWTFVQATAIAIFEQLIDVAKKEIEDTASKAVPGGAPWIQKKVLEFQYDAVNPQIVQLVGLVPQYPKVDPSLRIVTRCSVKTDLANNVRIKVAKGAIPGIMSNAEVNALQGYINTIGTAGVYYIVTSTDADQLYVEADIYYAGQYSAVVATNVIAAIQAYLAGIAFDGVVKISDLEKAIKAVDGVNDVVLKNVRARKGSDAFAGGSDLVLNNAEISRLWNTVAGYIIDEQTAGKTLADSLTFIAE
jgi:hypothetical protein